MTHLTHKCIAAIIGCLMLTTLAAQAQRGGGPRGEGFDPDRIRQMMMERFQERLEASDQEWTVIQPLIATVMDRQRETSRGRGGFGRGFFGRGGDDGNRRDRGDRDGNRPGRGGEDGDTELAALREAIESGDTAGIKTALTNLRAAREKNEEALQEARENLRKVLTAKQEGTLVLFGLLD